MLTVFLLFSFIFSALADGNIFAPIVSANDYPDIDFSSNAETASVRPPGAGDSPHPVQANLIADSIELRPGESFRIGVHLEQDDGWHTYWKSPGSIGQPTRIQWSIPDGATISDYQFPIPSYFEQFNIVSVGYEKEVLLFSTVTLPPDIPFGEQEFAAEIEWLVCKESCIPGKAELSLSIDVGDTKLPSDYVELFDYTANILPIQAHGSEHPLLENIEITESLSHSSAKANSPFQYNLRLEAKNGAPIQYERKQDNWPFLAPITGDFWIINETKINQIDDSTIQIQVDAEAFEGEEYPIKDKIGALFQFEINEEKYIIEVESQLSIVGPDDTVAATTTVSEETTNTKGAEQNNDSSDSEMGLLQALFFAFFGGMLLNIMPCVLPVLTLKLFSLVEQSDITPKEQKMAGLAYSGGIIASFLALAAMVVLLQNSFGLNIGWGFQFQYPEYVIGLATIVFVFGLSLLGVFEVPTIGANKANEMSNKEGWMEYFMIGVFATLLATPCSAPFLGTGIGFAFTLPAWGIFSFFAIAGLGLAFPFLAVAFYPPFFKILPQPGAWMDTFKQIMGFTLLATTVWLIDVLGAQTGIKGTTGFLIFLLFVSLSAWIFGKWGSVLETGKRQIQIFFVALAISSTAGFFFLETDFAEAEAVQSVSNIEELDFSTEIPWLPFSDENIATLKSQNKAIFIDFTADWCLSCKVNEKNVLETERVRNAMKEQGILPVKADWTRRDESISSWLKRYGKAGVPFYLIIHEDGSATALPEVLTTGIVLDAFAAAVE